METSEKVSSGVDELIQRLRGEGVEAGAEEKGRLIEEGRAEAARLVAEARAESERLLAEAARQIASERRAGEEALHLASRDTLLEVASQLSTAFAGRLRHIVAGELRDGEFLRQLILAVAGRAREGLPEDGRLDMSVCLDGRAAGPEAEAALHSILAGVGAEMLRDGVELETATGDQSGIKIRLDDGDVLVDFREEALSELLIGHLAPRFRAILRGMET
jgi:V/A-type H+-transporting ATPase subunit E